VEGVGQTGESERRISSSLQTDQAAAAKRAIPLPALRLANSYCRAVR
jgi:hypothetical protein